MTQITPGLEAFDSKYSIYGKKELKSNYLKPMALPSLICERSARLNANTRSKRRSNFKPKKVSDEDGVYTHRPIGDVNGRDIGFGKSPSF